MTDTTKVYQAMIDDAAKRFEAAMRESARTGRDCPDIWAVPPDHDLRRNGYLHVGYDTPPLTSRGDFPIHIHPRDNGASTFHNWQAVPYSAINAVLWRACRNLPIMPIYTATPYEQFVADIRDAIAPILKPEFDPERFARVIAESVDDTGSEAHFEVRGIHTASGNPMTFSVPIPVEIQAHKESDQ